MKIYGSLMNRIAEEGSQTRTPEVGEGCTIYWWSDREAGTVIRVETPKRVIIKQDKAVRVDKLGMTDAQTYSYERNPIAVEQVVSLCKDGKWHTGTTKLGQIVRFGFRDAYHDFSF